MRQYIRLFNADGTVQDFAPFDAPSGPVTKEEPSPPPPPRHQFREGDIVRCIAGSSRVPRGTIGVVRCAGTTGNPGVEWIGFRNGHDLAPYGITRHHPQSGWVVFPSDIEHVT